MAVGGSTLKAGNDKACGRLEVAGTFPLFHVQQSKNSDFILRSGGIILIDLTSHRPQHQQGGFLSLILFPGE